ncbi:MAG: hypothetical protein JW843_08545 [Candidatus Aminicenantes bacterium]|nr:hypothetical protein [Candidatus Aminicenantes bacterium]
MRKRRENGIQRIRGGEWFVFPLLVLFLQPVSAASVQAQDPTPTAKLGPLQKSLLVPGWGQISEGRILKGAAFLAAELACLAGALRQNHLGNSNYDLYRAATDPDSASRYRRLVERYDGRRNAFLLAGAAVWAINLLDIFGLVKKKTAEPGSLSLAIGIPHVSPRQIRLSIDCRF